LTVVAYFSESGDAQGNRPYSTTLSPTAKVTVTLDTGVTVELTRLSTLSGRELGGKFKIASEKSSALRVKSYTISGLADEAGNVQTQTPTVPENIDQGTRGKIIKINS